MEVEYLILLVEDEIEEKKELRMRLEDDKTFSKIVPMEVKNVWYKIYDASFEVNYKFLKHLKTFRGKKYHPGKFYNRYTRLNELLFDVSMSLTDFYGIKEDVIL